jgi:hypothetical protein
MEPELLYFANFGADDAKVAKATPEIPPMLVLDENGTQCL